MTSQKHLQCYQITPGKLQNNKMVLIHLPKNLLKWVGPKGLNPPVMVIGKKRVAAAISDSNLLGNTGRQK